MKPIVYAACAAREPYKITEAQKEIAKERRGYGKPKRRSRNK